MQLLQDYLEVEEVLYHLHLVVLVVVQVPHQLVVHLVRQAVEAELLHQQVVLAVQLLVVQLLAVLLQQVVQQAVVLEVLYHLHLVALVVVQVLHQLAVHLAHQAVEAELLHQVADLLV